MIRSRRNHSVDVRVVWGLVGILIVVLSGILIRVILNNSPTSVDSWWHDLMATHRSSFADVMTQGMNVFGGTLFMTIVTAAIVAALLILGRRREGIIIGLSVALAAGMSAVLKMAIARPRPADGIVDVGNDAFPSGHTTTAAVLTVAIAIAFPRVWTWALAAVWAAGMALSRTYLLVHWSSDVLAGMVLGASTALLVAAVASIALGKMRQRRRLPEASPSMSGVLGETGPP